MSFKQICFDIELHQQAIFGLNQGNIYIKKTASNNTKTFVYVFPS